MGEVCALKCSDIDFEKSILTVNRTVQRIKTMSSAYATTISIGKPKSRSSIRQIPLPDFLADMLNRFDQRNDSYVLSSSYFFFVAWKTVQLNWGNSPISCQAFFTQNGVWFLLSICQIPIIWKS